MVAVDFVIGNVPCKHKTVIHNKWVKSAKFYIQKVDRSITLNIIYMDVLQFQQDSLPQAKL